MRLKKDLQVVLDEIQNEAYCGARNAFSNLAGCNNGPVMMNAESVSRIIADGVRSGVEELLRNQYTDDDFEKDIGLK